MEGLGHTGDHEVIVIPAFDFTKTAALVHVLCRVLGMDRKRNPAITGKGCGSQGFKHQEPAVPLVLKLWFERDAKLRSLSID
jgi:hypothetical protein